MGHYLKKQISFHLTQIVTKIFASPCYTVSHAVNLHNCSCCTVSCGDTLKVIQINLGPVSICSYKKKKKKEANLGAHWLVLI